MESTNPHTNTLKSLTSSYPRNGHGLRCSRANALLVTALLVQSTPKLRHWFVTVYLHEIHGHPNISHEIFK